MQVMCTIDDISKDIYNNIKDKDYINILSLFPNIRIDFDLLKSLKRRRVMDNLEPFIIKLVYFNSNIDLSLIKHQFNRIGIDDIICVDDFKEICNIFSISPLDLVIDLDCGIDGNHLVKRYNSYKLINFIKDMELTKLTLFRIYNSISEGFYLLADSCDAYLQRRTF